MAIDPVLPRQLAPASGSPTAPFNVPSSTPGGLLVGAVVPVLAYSVTSSNSNPDVNHATSVYVGGSLLSETVPAYSKDGSSQYGYVTVSQTLVNSGSATTVPVAVEVDNWGPTSGFANVDVVTAENGGKGLAGEAGYAPVGLAYKVANAGAAAVQRRRSQQSQQAALWRPCRRRS